MSARTEAGSAERPPPPEGAESRWRAGLPLVFVFVSLLALAVQPLVTTRRAEAVRRVISERIEPARATLNEIELALALEVAAVRGFLIAEDTSFLLTYASSRQAEVINHGRLASLIASVDGGAGAMAARLRSLSDDWNAANEEVAAGGPTAALAGRLDRQQRLYATLIGATAELDRTLARAAERRRAEIRRLERLDALVTGALSLLALLAMLAILRTGRRIARQAARERSLRRELALEAERLEQRVAERTVALTAANAELQAFAHTVSHDLSAPVRAVGGFAQALREDAAERLTAEELDFVERIRRAAERMDVLIRDLLVYSRLSQEEIHLAPVDLSRLVEKALEPVRADLASAGARITVEEPLPRVLAHSTTVVQAVQNLLTNAVKFVRPGETPRVRVRAERRDGRVRLWVEDEGIGVGPEHRERIFRMFERLHGVEQYPGTGVGLAIVRRGLERMGGAAGMEPGAGRGSRFWIELPSAETET